MQEQRADFVAFRQAEAKLSCRVFAVIAVLVGVVGAAARAGGREAIRFFLAGADRVAEAVLTAGGGGERYIAFAGVVGAVAGEGGERWRALALLGEDLDHAA